LNIREALAALTQQLESDSAALDAQVLLADILDRSRTAVAAHPETDLSPADLEKLTRAVERLRSGEPLPYVIGHWEFFGLDLEVNPDVLIPRPETELLVEHAITWLEAHPGRRKVIEIGTGSGCIAVAIARHIPDVSLTASDISATALEVAKKNVRNHNSQKQVHLIQADLWSAFLKAPSPDQKFDMICSNPPYIPTQILHALPIFNREPEIALDGGILGLSVITPLISGASAWLADHGKMLVEFDITHRDLIFSTARENFKGRKIEIHPDLAGRERLLSVEN
jgi:release factor glutamine methyltransferase